MNKLRVCMVCICVLKIRNEHPNQLYKIPFVATMALEGICIVLLLVFFSFFLFRENQENE